jgi:hypothetical protein
MSLIIHIDKYLNAISYPRIQDLASVGNLQVLARRLFKQDLARSNKCNLRDLASTCKFILLKNLLTSTYKIP